MKEKGFVLVPIIIVLLIAIGGYFGYRFFQQQNQAITSDLSLSTPGTSLSPTLSPNTIVSSPIPNEVQKAALRLYPSPDADQSVYINNTHVIGVLFSPSDGSKTIKSHWLANMGSIFADLKRFYEHQFPGSLSITYTIVGSLINGDGPANSYTPESMAIEAIQKTNEYKKAGQHNVWMIYFVRDDGLTINVLGGSLGGVVKQNAATQFEFWLDDDAVGEKGYGTIGSLHEFGHALGIPHPWELPANTMHDPNFGNVPGDVMGYMNSGVSVSGLYLRDDVKQAMGWKK